MKNRRRLEKELEKINLHEHLGHIFDSLDDWLLVSSIFVADGLKKGQRCLCVAPQDRLDELRQSLSNQEIDAARAIEAGQLSLIVDTSFFIGDGAFNPEGAVARLIEETRNSQDMGFSALRLLIMMNCTFKEYSGSGALIDYIWFLDTRFLPHYPCLAVHQYDLRECEPEILKSIIAYHPWLIRNRRVYRNLYYLKPGQHRSPREQSRRELENWLQALEDVQKSMERSRLLDYVISNSTQAFYAERPTGQLVMINPAFARLIGYTMEELQEPNWEINITPEEWREETIRAREVLLQTGEPQRFEKAYWHKEGRRVYVEVLLQLIKDDQGYPRYVYAFINDITRYKQMLEALRQSEELYRTIFEASGAAMMIVEEDGTISLTNDVLNRMSGYSREEVEGKMNFQFFVLEEYREMLNENHLRIRAENDLSLQSYEVKFKTKSGEIKDVIITAALIPGTGRLVVSLIDVTDVNKSMAALQESEARFRKAFQASPDLWAILDLNSRRFIDVNDAFIETLGLRREEVVGKTPEELDIWIEHSSINEITVGLLTTGSVRGVEIKVRTRSGELRIGQASAEVVDFGGLYCALLVIRDVTEQYRAEEALRRSEELYRIIFETTGNPTIMVDENGVIVLVNYQFEKYFGRPKAEVEGKLKWSDFVVPEEIDRLLEYQRLRLENPNLAPREYECQVISANGEVRDAIILVALVPGTLQRVVSILDITERKRNEEQLRYMGLHDCLTGLYNRTYFEEEMRRLESGRSDPVGLIMFDVDGLKLVNDTLGHAAGDELLKTAAELIRGCFRENDVVARVGGDEFAALLPSTPAYMTSRACARVQDAIARYNMSDPPVPLSISMGYATREGRHMSMEMLFQEADNNMYRMKAESSRALRTELVLSLVRRVNRAKMVSDEEARQMEEHVVALGQAVGIPNHRLPLLRLLATFYDVGLAGIPDEILIKQGKLNREEIEEMHRHAELGHRIVQAVPDLVSIAEWVLRHHEWWNGEGYPQGLKGKAIPIEARILAVCEAFSAMTHDRPYRRAMPVEEALAELERGAGNQFDPDLVAEFKEIVKKTR